MDGSWNIGSIGFSGPPLRGPSSARLVAEPPLSPPVSGSSPMASAQPVEPSSPLASGNVHPSEAPPAAPLSEPARPAASLESLLMRFRLITSDQLDEALREKAATGKDVGAIVVERGWVNEDQLARLLSYAPAFTAEPAQSPPPLPELMPLSTPAPDPEPAPFATDLAPALPERQPEAPLDLPSEVNPEPERAALAESEAEPEPAAEPEPLAEAPVQLAPWPAIPPALELVDEPSSGFAPAPFELAPAPKPEAHEEADAEPTAPAIFEPSFEPLPEPAALAEPEPAPAPELEAEAQHEPEPAVDVAAPAFESAREWGGPEPVAAEPEPAADADPEPEPEPKPKPEPAMAEALPEVAPEPEPERASEPMPAPVAAEPQVVRFVEPPSIETIARVFVRLSNGERVEAGSFDDMAAAKAHADEVVAQVSNGANGWPFFAGRYIRPEAVISVDLDATVVRYA